MCLVCSMATQECHDGPCGPCFLPKTHCNKYANPEHFDSEQYTFLCGVEEREVSIRECIATPALNKIKINVGNESLDLNVKHAELSPHKGNILTDTALTQLLSTHTFLLLLQTLVPSLNRAKYAGLARVIYDTLKKIGK